MKKDIETRDDVVLLVDVFYNKVGLNPLIGPIFHGILKNDWQPHLNKMYNFWETVLFENTHTYNGAPFPPHRDLPLDQIHFDTWITIFKETVAENFDGPRADEALWRAGKMAEMFLHKIKYFRGEA
ncbi:group III truncated hemoglobin [Flavobacterium agricola]|uniref:Group III truncated hemoglobin n=1 Tax=Flavobacterium agricola TaxID=2870839 RepID=A0ABY6LZ56_9FLAO|nr:group III truncated hemoglobin [Flavobacterium agricola]UYW01609.1 group III truncated hemoglobin [Flavobacterium agricola]